VRLDHLLSKEHHEIWAGPHIADHRDSDDSLDGLSPVVGGGLVHEQTTDRWERAFGRPVENDCQTHCWVLRQQARRLFAPFGEPEVSDPPVRGCGVVVAPLGGGVWCLIRG
jgi:hypothetical protein